MRLCRFAMGDGVPLTGLFADDRVIPLDQAADAYSEETSQSVLIPESDDPVALLPPRGASPRAARDLARWAAALDRDRLEGLSVPLGEARLLPPLARPGKLLLLAGNYSEHVAEQGYAAAVRSETFPYVFMKPPTALAASGDPIRLPRVSPDALDWECELGVVIGARCKGATPAEALGFVGGYTVVNDISDRGFRPNPGRTKRERDAFFDWLHGKWHDGSCPVGPCIRAADGVADPQDLTLRLTLNGEVMQQASTAQMIFTVAEVVAFISSFVTLEPGDLISTGTPAGVGKARGRFLRPGDEVVAEVEGIGRLVNPVEAEE